MATNVINGVSPTPIGALEVDQGTEAVLYVEQDLSPSQKKQARQNIGVAGKSEVAYLGDIVARV